MVPALTILLIPTTPMFEIFLTTFFERSLLVGSILGMIMALIGVFVVLRRLSFFSDAIGHSALTGIALGLLLHFNPFLAALAFALVIALAIAFIRTRSRLPIDTLLGVFFPAAVALGVILVYLAPGYRNDLISYLFGDILTVGNLDIVLSLVLGTIVLGVLVIAGKKFILLTFNSELAKAEGLAVSWYETLFLLILAGTIALAIKLVGIVLVTALLIIPAATAQNLSRSLLALFTISVMVGLISVVVGMVLSALLSVPSGPTIVLTGAVLFLLSFCFQAARR